ncbi:MAG: 50S ribosomal protein L21 [Gaiellaceae bacterium]
MSAYAVVKIGGKQYRVSEGQRLLVDRLPYGEGKTFHPDLLMVGGEGEPKLGADGLEGQQVTAKVAEHVLGEKLIIGKYRKRTGYRRRRGFRAHLTRIEIQSIGKQATRSATARKATSERKTPEKTAKKSEEKG